MEYFCTCGRGTESFLITELRRKFSLKKVHQRDGKVWFTLSEQEYKEHLFTDSVQSTLQSSDHFRTDFHTSNGVQTVQHLLGLKSCERLFVSVLHDRKIVLNNHQQAIKQIKSILFNVVICDWSRYLQAWRALTITKERSYDESTCKLVKSVLRSPRYKRTTDYSNRETIDDIEDGPSAKRAAIDDQYPKSAASCVSFRVSAKCSGSASRFFTPQSLSSLIGPIVSRITGWKADLRSPLLEIYVQLNHEGFTIGLPVSGAPLSKRPYLKHAGLRTTIASIMSSLAGIQSGMMVLDPMCGEGTILIEAAKLYPECLYYGCDVDLTQCRKAMDNITFSNESKRVHVIHASVSSLPLHNEIFDAVLCDIPFGLKHGTVEGNKILYPEIIITINRVLKYSGRVVLLVGAQLKVTLLDIVESLYQQSHVVNSLDEQNHAVDSLDEQNHTVDSIDEQTLVVECLDEQNLVVDSLDEQNVVVDSLDEQNVVVDSLDEQNPVVDSLDKHNPVVDSLDKQNLVVGSIEEQNHTGDSFVHGLDEQIKVVKVNVEQTPYYLTTKILPGADHKQSENTEEEKKTHMPTNQLSKTINQDNQKLCSHWTTELVHYVKLGETHAYICVFHKQFKTST